MNSVNKTLFIPLYGKSFVSKKRLFLEDKKAEEIWSAEGFRLKGKSASKWLAYYMGIRAAVYDEWLKFRLIDLPDAVVIHIGCGLDSRVLRVGTQKHKWYDIDFPAVIDERKRYFSENTYYQMLPGDAGNPEWLKDITERSAAIVVMEGISMYLTADEVRNLMAALCSHFERVDVLMDCYSLMAAKLSKYKNPVNDVGVTEVYGVDDPAVFQQGKLHFVKEHCMTPERYIDQLQGFEKRIFKKLYAGGFSRKLYRLFEYRKEF